MTDFDTIVVGSGAGGLTAALALARAGERVLVLEQHYVPGGWCHSFTLGGLRFSPGVHYIGELQEGGYLRRIYEGLGVAQDLSFFELNPDGFDHLRIGGDRFDVPRGKERYAARLAARFPREERGIRAYLDIVERISRELNDSAQLSTFSEKLSLPLRIPTTIRYGLLPLGHVLGGLVVDPLLRAILSIQCGDHGMPPGRVPTAMHAAIAGHYFNGGYYPKGGGFRIPRAFVRGLRRAGGELRLKTRVSRILVERGRATGVQLEDGTEVSSKRVISNADPGITFGKLIHPSSVPWRLRRRVARTRYSISAISLFLGVDIDARAAGLDSGNYWYSRTQSIDHGYDPHATIERLANGDTEALFLTVTTLKDPTKRKGGVETMEAFTFVPFDAFAAWAESQYGDRPEGYEAAKDKLRDSMLKTIDHLVPGVRERVVFSEVGTPLTNVHYVAATNGSLYGTEKSLSQIGPFGFQPRTPIRDLWMCGASTIGHGVMGATVSGLVAASQILGVAPRELLTARGGSLEILSAESPAVAPAPRRETRVDREASIC